jgi:HlyD family type I secretion membrane fusion protein
MSASPVGSGPLADSFVLKAALTCLVGLGGFLVWAGFVPLAEGVPASGQIVAEDNRQVVQHLEGGIIRELLVREGDHVAAGDPLLILEETASLASRDQVVQEIATLTGSLRRLEALREGHEQPDFSAIDEMDLGDAERQQVIDRQMDLFRQQRQTLEADLAVLTARRDGARVSNGLHAQQIAVTRRVRAAAQSQLELMRERYGRQMARLDEIRAVERDVASLDADISRLRTEAQQAQTLEEDYSGQIAQAEAAFARQISEESLQVRTELQSSEEHLNAAQDVLNRSVVFAPQSGEVLNLRYSTRGGVVRPGDAILEIVPEDGEVTASVRIQPHDRAAVFQGQEVRTRVTAYKSWVTPQLDGEVISVSADLKVDTTTGASYYEVRILIPADEVLKLAALDVIPGMPIEAFIYSGSSRTTLDYLLEPITESLFRGTRTG